MINLPKQNTCNPGGIDLSATIPGANVLIQESTGRSTSYANGNYGSLSSGYYQIQYNGDTYRFRVVNHNNNPSPPAPVVDDCIRLDTQNSCLPSGIDLSAIITGQNTLIQVATGRVRIFPNGNYQSLSSGYYEVIVGALKYCFRVVNNPNGLPPPPVENNFLLLETGDFILLETGDKIIIDE